MSTKPNQLDVPRSCINLSYRKAGRVISQIYDRHLAECSLKCTQFSLLRAIDELRETTNRELQEALVLDQTTLTRNLKPLIRDGLVQVKPGSDRRQKKLSLSAAGAQLHRAASKHWARAQRRIVGQLGSERAVQMLTLNDALIELHG